MKFPTPKQELRELQHCEVELRNIHLKRYLALPSLATPNRDEQLAVAAYVVLLHGSFENFVEGLALRILEITVNGWTFKKRVSRHTASLLLHHPVPQTPIKEKTVYDTLRVELDGAKSWMSQRIKDNNGITLEHLRDLFFPLGVDVPDDPVIGSSLKTLVSIRHDWAHQYRLGTKTVRSASDAFTAASDCLRLAEQLTEAAVRPRP